MFTRFAPLVLPLLASCAASQHSTFITVTTQPANVGDAGIAARPYHDSGAYDRDLAIVANQADRWIAVRALPLTAPRWDPTLTGPGYRTWKSSSLKIFGRPSPVPANL